MPGYNNEVKTPKALQTVDEKYLLDITGKIQIMTKPLFETASKMETPDILVDPTNVFLFGEDGKLVNPKEINPATAVNFAMANRLFVKDKDSNLRQIQLEEKDGKIAFGVSGAVRDMEPKRPAFWKYLLYPFFAGQIREYNQKKEFKDVYMKSDAYVAPVVPDEAPMEEKKPAKKPEAVKMPTKMTSELTKFEKRLNDYVLFNKNSTIGACMKRDRTRQSIQDSMLTAARRATAQQIITQIEKNPKMKVEILWTASQTYDNLINDIRDFLPRTYSSAELDMVVKNGVNVRNEKGEHLAQKFDFIAETALENYNNFVKAGRTNNFQQRKYISGAEYSKLCAEGKAGTKLYCEPEGIHNDVQKEQAPLKESAQGIGRF